MIAPVHMMIDASQADLTAWFRCCKRSTMHSAASQTNAKPMAHPTARASEKSRCRMTNARKVLRLPPVFPAEPAKIQHLRSSCQPHAFADRPFDAKARQHKSVEVITVPDRLLNQARLRAGCVVDQLWKRLELIEIQHLAAGIL